MRRFVLAGIGLSIACAIGASDQPVAPAASGITSVILPPTSERSVTFSDRGRTYLVGTVSGKVTVVDAANPQPVNPPAPYLTGLAKQVYDSVTSSPIDAQNRVLGAKALISAIDSTLSEAGGLGVADPQAIINLLASNAEAAQVNQLLKGWRLGDLLAGASITTKDQLIKALNDIKAGLEAVR